MKIKIFTTGPIETNSYLVYDEIAKEGILIDAPNELHDILLHEVKKNDLKISYIINTHGHWDHINDNEIIKKSLNATLLIHKDDEFLMDPADDIKSVLPLPLDPSKADDYLKDNDIIKTGSIEFKIIHTPGHSPGGICIYEPKNKVLFAGDTLFNNSIGRTDLWGGSIEDLISSIKEKLFILPDDVTVYPGHGEATTIGNEKKFNPYI
jgi:hydroxyacylglutathione hydrolase